MTDSMREAMQAAQPAYEAAQAALAEQVKTCRYCKAAKTRKYQKVIAVGASPERAAELSEGTMCGKHAQRSRLNFTTSPVSETYWSS